MEPLLFQGHTFNGFLSPFGLHWASKGALGPPKSSQRSPRVGPCHTRGLHEGPLNPHDPQKCPQASQDTHFGTLLAPFWPP